MRLGGVVLLLLLTSCIGDVVSEFCSYPSRLSLQDTDLTQMESLNGAVNGMNTFARLYLKNTEAKAYIVESASADGNVKNSVRVSSERTPCVLGVDNISGVIVGNSSMRQDNPYIYDRICSNCYAESRTLSGKVEFDASGITVTCTRCHRKYDLLNGGLVVAGENGQKLFRYYGQRTAGGGFYISNPH